MFIILANGRQVDLTPKQVDNFRLKARLTDAIMATPGPTPAIPGDATPPHPEGDCHPWGGRLDRDGYGTYSVKRHGLQAILTAHRLAYVIHRGEQIPEAHQLDHLCRVPASVNPLHLQAVPPVVNTRRGYGPAVRNAAKTHCVNGHALSGNNLRPIKNKPHHRACRECHRAASRRYRGTLHP